MDARTLCGPAHRQVLYSRGGWEVIASQQAVSEAIIKCTVREEGAKQAAPSDEEAIPPAGHDSGRQQTLTGEVTLPRNQDSRPMRDESELSKNLTPAPSVNGQTTLNTSTKPREAVKELLRAPTQCEVTMRSGKTRRKAKSLCGTILSLGVLSECACAIAVCCELWQYCSCKMSSFDPETC